MSTGVDALREEAAGLLPRRLVLVIPVRVEELVEGHNGELPTAGLGGEEKSEENGNPFHRATLAGPGKGSISLSGVLAFRSSTSGPILFSA
jgi:hypothetical protein